MVMVQCTHVHVYTCTYTMYMMAGLLSLVVQEDDHNVIMFTRRHQPTPPHRSPGNHHYGHITHGRRRTSAQISQDEELARRLQAQYDQELDISVQAPHPLNAPRHISPPIQRRPWGPPPPISVFTSPSPSPLTGLAEGNLWSSTGVCCTCTLYICIVC